MIRRLFLTLAAALAVVGSPLAADLAQAREHGGGRGQGQGQGPGGDRPRYERPRGYERRGDGPPRYDAPRGGPPDWPRYGGPPRERYEPDPYREPRGSVVRPGRYLPPSYRGDVIEDYGRYRLRPPPRGYVWVRIGRGMALVSVDDGQIFDVVPY